MDKNSVTETILQEGVDFTLNVTKPTFLHKIKLQKQTRKFVIYPICLGSLLKIAKLLNEIKIDLKPGENKNFMEFAIEQIIQHADKYAEIIALAIINRPFSDSAFIRYFEKIKFKSLIRFIERSVNDKEALRLFNIVIQQMDVQHFLACMVSIKGMDLNLPTETEVKTSGDS